MNENLQDIENFIGKLNDDTITTFCGEPGIGKTTICFQYMADRLKSGKKVIFVDTEGGFCIERLMQIDRNINLNNIIVFSPKNFEKQNEIIKNLNDEIKNDKDISLIIIDSIVMLYRLELSDNPAKINSKLAKQLQLLTEISRTFKIPIITTNQIYYDFKSNDLKMAGGTLIQYWSKTIIYLKKNTDTKEIIIKKHKYKKEGIQKFFTIDDSGILLIK